VSSTSRAQRDPASASATGVVAVVPTFYPTEDVRTTLGHVIPQVDQVVVVDDGSGVDADEQLAAIAALGVTVLRLAENSGIATALNTGVKAAFDGGASHVLTLDQDTHLPSDYVTVALGIFARAHPVTNVGIVVVDGVNGASALPSARSPEGLYLVPEAIQTGMLLSRECYQTVGPFDERLVIDCVDTEYCLRATDHSFRIAIAAGTSVRHTIGRRAQLRPFGIPIRHRGSGQVATYQYHSPFRRYYIARNNVDLVFRNARRRPRWVLAVAKRETGGMIVSMVSGPQRLAQILAVITGTVHGLVRRRGKLPRWLQRVIS